MAGDVWVPLQIARRTSRANAQHRLVSRVRSGVLCARMQLQQAWMDSVHAQPRVRVITCIIIKLTLKVQ